jgi:hypothetical protein
VENPSSEYIDLHPSNKNTMFARFFGLVEEIENWYMMRADKAMQPFCQSSHCDSE